MSRDPAATDGALLAFFSLKLTAMLAFVLSRAVECIRRTFTIMACAEYGDAARVSVHHSECWACAGLRT